MQKFIPCDLYSHTRAATSDCFDAPTGKLACCWIEAITFSTACRMRFATWSDVNSTLLSQASVSLSVVDCASASNDIKTQASATKNTAKCALNMLIN